MHFFGFMCEFGLETGEKPVGSMEGLSAEHTGDEVFVYGYEGKPTAAN